MIESLSTAITGYISCSIFYSDESEIENSNWLTCLSKVQVGLIGCIEQQKKSTEPNYCTDEFLSALLTLERYKWDPKCKKLWSKKCKFQCPALPGSRNRDLNLPQSSRMSLGALISGLMISVLDSTALIPAGIASWVQAVLNGSSRLKTLGISGPYVRSFMITFGAIVSDLLEKQELMETNWIRCFNLTLVKVLECTSFSPTEDCKAQFEDVFKTLSLQTISPAQNFNCPLEQ